MFSLFQVLLILVFTYPAGSGANTGCSQAGSIPAG